MECWDREPEERPTFQALRELLWKFQKEEHAYVNFDPNEGVSLPPTSQGTEPSYFGTITES